jgi:hypothetical protein
MNKPNPFGKKMRYCVLSLICHFMQLMRQVKTGTWESQKGRKLGKPIRMVKHFLGPKGFSDL